MDITLLQEVGLKKLMANIDNFQKGNYGTITDFMLLTNPNAKNSIFVKYQKQEGSLEYRGIEQVIIEINTSGEIKVVSDVFKNIYERYAFIGESVPIDIKDLIVI